MNKIWKKIIGISFCVVLCMIMAIAPIGDNFNVKFPISQSSKVAKAATFNDFINDARWRDGTWWGSGKRPELSGWPCSECMAYAADFTKYMYGIDNPRDGEAYYNINDVRAGDVINVPGHWFVVLGRSGNSLYTAEGNVGGYVWVRNGRYTITNGKFQYKSSATSWSNYSLSVGYHYGGPADKEAPKISNIKITGKDKNGYTVSCTVTDNVGVTSVKFPSWNTDNGRTSANCPWIDGIISGNTASATVEIKYLNSGAIDGNYLTHIYAYDAAGNSSNASAGIVYIDRTAPVISDVELYECGTNYYTVRCKASDDRKITRVQFPSWTVANGQDDIVSAWWENSKASGTLKEDGYYYYTVLSYDHNNEYLKYRTHIYAYDECGNSTCVKLGKDVDLAKWDIVVSGVPFYPAYSKEACMTGVRLIDSSCYPKTEIPKITNVKLTAYLNGKEIQSEEFQGDQLAMKSGLGIYTMLIDTRQATEGYSMSAEVTDEAGETKTKKFSFKPNQNIQTNYMIVKVGETFSVPGTCWEIDFAGESQRSKNQVVTDILDENGEKTGEKKALKAGRTCICQWNNLTGGCTSFWVIDVIDDINDNLELSSEEKLSLTDAGLLTGVAFYDNTVADICGQFKNTGLVCMDAKGNELSQTDPLMTGATINLKNGDTVKSACTVVIKGDIVGDGELNLRDVTAVAQYCLNKRTLTEAQLEAADVVEDGEVNLRDVTRLAQCNLNKAKISSQK